MTARRKQKITFAVFAGLSLLGTVTGCSTSSVAATLTTPAPAPSTEAAAPTGSASSSASAYKDGTYTEKGSYQAPSGTESVSVTITLAAGVVTAVTVVGNDASRDSQRYQSQFIAGIGAEVVGKKIDSLSVTKVAGSSLTSGGFNSAVDVIKADAAA